MCSVTVILGNSTGSQISDLHFAFVSIIVGYHKMQGMIDKKGSSTGASNAELSFSYALEIKGVSCSNLQAV